MKWFNPLQRLAAVIAKTEPKDAKQKNCLLNIFATEMLFIGLNKLIACVF